MLRAKYKYIQVRSDDCDVTISSTGLFIGVFHFHPHGDTPQSDRCQPLPAVAGFEGCNPKAPVSPVATCEGTQDPSKKLDELWKDCK